MAFLNLHVWKLCEDLHASHSFFSRPYLVRSGYCYALSSIFKCTMAKRYVIGSRRWYRWIGRWWVPIDSR